MQDQDSAHVIRFSGSLAVSHVPELQQQLLDAIDGGRSVCLDVSAGTDIDIGFLQILVAAHKTAVDDGKTLTIADRGSAHLREQMARCGLPDSALPKFTTAPF